jgi:hypothetical protein
MYALNYNLKSKIKDHFKDCLKITLKNMELYASNSMKNVTRYKYRAKL